ncbi:MAG: MBL fold metallo-hydrolase [Proteobacteria bacterium]|nr:MBL fold metallo-hydrolase [Pseudomonadota bacterium]
MLPVLLLLACGTPTAPSPPPTAVSAPAKTEPSADLELHPIEHGTLYFTHGDTVLWLDPVGSLEGHPKADVVLITDIHGDHLDADALSAIRKADATVVAPQPVAAQLPEGAVTTVLANDATTTIGALSITATPMYNHTRGPEPGKLFHDKGRGNGYLIEVGAERVYIAGDTACTDEMRALTGVTHALVPMNLPYTMPPEEAADCVRSFKPVKVTPYHHRGSDLDVFRAALEGSDVVVGTAEFYPNGE